MLEKTVWETLDGHTFPDKKQAKKHETAWKRTQALLKLLGGEDLGGSDFHAGNGYFQLKKVEEKAFVLGIDDCHMESTKGCEENIGYPVCFKINKDANCAGMGHPNCSRCMSFKKGQEKESGMNAQEARKLMEEVLKNKSLEYLPGILAAIERAAKQGESRVQYRLSACEETVWGIIAELTRLGFIVGSGADFGGSTTDVLNITWVETAGE
jgi:hypothetical protein